MRTGPSGNRCRGGTEEELGPFVARLFASLSRSDQRRRAEDYVRGLLSVSGRKSLRRIAGPDLSEPVLQSLQQFVNQSPWDWRPVRHRLAEHVAERLAPTAWLLADAVIPKSGRHSVGVARRFVPAMGRTLNCQLGIGLFLASASAAVPVDWRLVLTEPWGADATLRRRVGLPDDEQVREEWRVALDLVDELRSRWDGDPLPVVADATGAPGARHLLSGLAARGLPALVEVDARVEVVDARHLAAVPPARQGQPGQPARRGVQPVSAGQLGRVRGPRSRFAVVPVQLAGPQRCPVPASGPFHLVVEPGEDGGRRWIATPALAAGDAPALVRLRDRATAFVAAVRDDFGLCDFEGRSFRGWHHHATLVSAAHAFAVTAGTTELAVESG
ncbi:SRSO17 transposase [Streptoalloteichus tenebrarius]|uniref:SRSO17 transposase n=1 Tax=Streptoalloteichus tenebrarius (strain ATCC 17920 / DSM 40477 / JCM 4838 / CBS 697.72 / NBRC 16177 / NCIMB 11028 / NRRL B-12390 / A12253. 1 / ISP 5477) TaxID=1933 RepID=A0ABT1HML8_STRSD|nr:transposase [Streptoalloteichus tenebrarius]MCP2256755.1 SRSO17 transposase [Streptoalloteichus tenebrarius]